MSLKTKSNVVAIIDIGSSETRLRIVEKGKGRMHFLESVHYPLNLAKDTFNKGKISFEKVNKVCEILNGFLKICTDYGVSNIKAIATTAIREATNRPYILDQIKVNTNLDIKIIDDNTEKLYIFKMITYIIADNLKNSTLMSYIGSGSIGTALMEDGAIPIIQNAKAGSLRISEMFEKLQEYSTEFYIVYEEYLADYMENLSESLPEKVDNFIASGIEMPLIARICNSVMKDNFYYIDKEIFINLYNEVKFKTFNRISKEYDITIDKAETILAEMCIYKSLLELTCTKVLIVPAISLAEAMAFEILFTDEFTKINKEFIKNTLASAEKMAKKYNITKGHYKTVENAAIEIFDKMKKVHGLDRSDKLLLQVAAILHDCGKYINMENHHIHSYNIIKGSEIAGLSEDEIDIVANISLYHSRIVPNVSDENYRDLKQSKKVLTSKLAAILRLADALDRGKKQKISEMSFKIEEGELLVNIVTDKNCELEKWAFKEKGMFFQEVFGIKPILKIRRVI